MSNDVIMKSPAGHHCTDRPLPRILSFLLYCPIPVRCFAMAPTATILHQWPNNNPLYSCYNCLADSNDSTVGKTGTATKLP